MPRAPAPALFPSSHHRHHRHIAHPNIPSPKVPQRKKQADGTLSSLPLTHPSLQPAPTLSRAYDGPQPPPQPSRPGTTALATLCTARPAHTPTNTLVPPHPPKATQSRNAPTQPPTPPHPHSPLPRTQRRQWFDCATAPQRPAWRHQRGKAKAYSTRYSQEVSHPSTNQARPCLASEIGRDRALPGWDGRRHGLLLLQPSSQLHATATTTTTARHLPGRNQRSPKAAY